MMPFAREVLLVPGSRPFGPEFPDGFDRFGACLGDEDDGTTLITESDAHLVSEIFFILVRKQIFAIDEEEKGGRSFPDLSCVKELQAMPLRADGLATFDCILQSAIQN